MLLSVNTESFPVLERARPLLGTLVTIRARAPALTAEAAIAAAFACIADVQRCMSFHDPDSELSALNRLAHLEPQYVSPALHRVLNASLVLAHNSAGCFDPTIAWRLVEWGQLPAPVSATVDPDASWHDVRILRDGRVHFTRPLWIDLGGIAKGYAVDRAVRVLRQYGVIAGVVNAGGDLRAFGSTEVIYVRDPADPTRSFPLLTIRDAAVATSAGYFSEKDGHTALIHPLRGESVGHTCSVTICARYALWADALTKVVLVAPRQVSSLLHRLHASAMLIDSDGTRRRLN